MALADTELVGDAGGVELRDAVVVEDGVALTAEVVVVEGVALRDAVVVDEGVVEGIELRDTVNVDESVALTEVDAAGETALEAEGLPVPVGESDAHTASAVALQGEAAPPRHDVQLVQAAAPSTGANLPTAHTLHDAPPWVGAYAPAVHEVHIAEVLAAVTVP